METPAPAGEDETPVFSVDQVGLEPHVVAGTADLAVGHHEVDAVSLRGFWCGMYGEVDGLTGPVLVATTPIVVPPYGGHVSWRRECELRLGPGELCGGAVPGGGELTRRLLGQGHGGEGRCGQQGKQGHDGHCYP